MFCLNLSHSYNIHPSLESFEITADCYLSQQPEFAGIVGAAIVIHNSQVLLLQRSADDDCPNLWEVPGGGANGDETLIQCAVRELKEETSLEASDVLGMIGEFEWMETGSRSGNLGETKIWKIFMFLVTVESLNENLEIHLDQQEHQTYLWATETDIREGSCGGTLLQWISPNQPQAILAALKILRS
ncbi:hypothetical protein N7541_003275 [Penicillium brevicompactum]|uniref:Nudix hydrolase domain-containing protein n=1 Tax=Penicillium brevicompactum TaxID=5074 RepID=A0A9W9RLJ7_PENBR|nr:hypothetical protein N7541_003275 [Penicillium brevicompactum]